MEKSPIVFISYSWDNEEHCKWVTKLACILINNSVEVLIDRFEVMPGSNLQSFMNDGLNKSKWVLCVCTNDYIRKMDNPTTGVGKETKLSSNLNRSEFVIPLLRNNSLKILPESLEGKFYIDFSAEPVGKKISDLLQRILGVSVDLAPTLGRNPFDNAIVHDRILEAKIEKSTYINPELSGIVSFDYSDNNGEFTIGTGKYAFSTMWSKAGKTRIYAYKDANNIECIGLIPQTVSLDDVVTTKGINYTSRVRNPAIGDAIVWINTSGNIAITHVQSIDDNTRGDEKDNIVFDYKILIIPI